MPKWIRNLSAISMTAVLSACSMLPVMKMNADKGSAEQTQYRPKLIPINNELVQEMAQSIRHDQYIIGPADTLSINIWSHPEFDSPAGIPLNAMSMSQMMPQQGMQPAGALTNYVVDGAGDIFFPMIGDFHVAGHSVAVVQAELAYALSKYIKNPQVTVQVGSFNSQQVYVMGAVMQPKLLPVTNTPISLGSALQLAGGMNNLSANTKEIYVIRGATSSPQVYWLDGQSPVSMLLAEAFPLQNRDVVFVSTTGLSDWNNLISQLLPTIQTVWYTKALINQ